MKSGYFLYFAQLILLFAIYFLTAKFGLSINAVSGFATLVWIPTGISFAALFLFGFRLWPAIFAGAFLVNFMTGAPILAALGIASGNTLEAVIATYLLKKTGFRKDLERVNDVLKLIFYAAFLSTIVSSTIGVMSLTFANVIGNSEFWSTWTAWWVGDMLSNLTIAPLIFVWSGNYILRLERGKNYRRIFAGVLYFNNLSYIVRGSFLVFFL